MLAIQLNVDEGLPHKVRNTVLTKHESWDIGGTITQDLCLEIMEVKRPVRAPIYALSSDRKATSRAARHAHRQDQLLQSKAVPRQSWIMLLTIVLRR